MKIVIIILAIVVLTVATVTTCAYKLYEGVKNFPEQASVEYLSRTHPDLIIDLNKAIANSDSAFSLASELEKITYPDDTLAVSLNNGSEDGLIIFNNLTNADNNGSSRRSRAIINRAGYGTVNGQRFWILQHPLNKYEYDEIEILFVREESDLES